MLDIYNFSTWGSKQAKIIADQYIKDIGTQGGKWSDWTFAPGEISGDEISLNKSLETINPIIYLYSNDGTGDGTFNAKYIYINPPKGDTTIQTLLINHTKVEVRFFGDGIAIKGIFDMTIAI